MSIGEEGGELLTTGGSWNIGTVERGEEQRAVRYRVFPPMNIPLLFEQQSFDRFTFYLQG
jgi:hypothetical protein